MELCMYRFYIFTDITFIFGVLIGRMGCGSACGGNDNISRDVSCSKPSLHYLARVLFKWLTKKPLWRYAYGAI